jgi:hypothetical protein
VAIVYKIDIAGNAGGWFDETATSSGWFYRELEDTAPAAPDETVYGIDQSYLDVTVQGEYQNLNTDFGTDYNAPVVEDVVVVDLSMPNVSFPDELPEDDPDWTNWSWAQAPPVDDNNPELAPSNLDGQDFTDLEDYGFSVAPLVDGSNPEVSLSAVALDTQDFTDTEDYGYIHNPIHDADEECLFPVVTSVTAGSDLTTGTAHVVTFTASVGDGILVVLATNGNTHTATAGWTEVVDNESAVSYWRVIDGTEGGTMTVTSSASSESVWYVYRIQAGTFDPGTPPSSAVTLNSATQDPPNDVFGWTDKTLVLAAIAGDTDTSPITFTSGPSNLTNGFVGQETGGTQVPDAYLAVGWGNVDGSSFDPNAFSITAQSQPNPYDLATIAIRGNCRVQQSIIALDTQDFTDTEDYSFIPSPVPPCPNAEIVAQAKTEITTSATTHLITLPSGVQAGDRLIVSARSGQPWQANPPAGWQFFSWSYSAAGGIGVINLWKDADGTEGATLSLDVTSSSTCYAFAYRIKAGTFDPYTAPEASDSTTGSSQNINAVSYTAPWSGETLFIARTHQITGSAGLAYTAYPANMPDWRDVTTTSAPIENGATAAAQRNSSTFDPDAFTLNGSGNTWSVRVFGIRANCGSEPPLWSHIQNDDQDFTDLEDYGSFTAPLSEDLTPSEDFLLGAGGLDEQDFTDLEDYGAITPQPIDDNNPDVAPSDLDSQDFTDLGDYGYSVAPLSDDNNPEVCVAAIALDTQDFTDLADYGFSWNAPADLDEQDPDLGQIDCDSQDFTDLEDYGSSVAPAIDDNNPEIAPSSLDDQDFSDLEDYGYVAQQAIEDFILKEDFILGDGQGLDSQDFTDEADYGSSVAPLSDDSVDFLLGTGDGLDAQDFTDEADYGSSVAPAINDNNLEIAPSDLDTQDFTDLADYGSSVAPAIDDFNPEVSLAAVALDTQDFTDLEDYGLVVAQAIPDNNDEVCLAAVALDDQDWSDLEDYGFSVAPLVDDFIAPEDFNLGDGKGLDTQDFTDTADYSFIWFPLDEIPRVYVTVTGIELVIEIGCVHTVSWADIPDVVKTWDEIANTTSSWSPIADVPHTWTDTPNTSDTWTEIPNTPNTWEEDC